MDLSKLPGGPRPWLYGAAAVAAVAGFMWWRRGSTQGSAGAALSAEDAALAAAGTGPYVNPNPRASGSDTINDAGDAETSSDWAQQVIQNMPLYGWESDFVAITLGKYFAGQPLTEEEALMIRSAWALFGKPVNAPALAMAGSITPAPSGSTTIPTRKSVPSSTFDTASPAVSSGTPLRR